MSLFGLNFLSGPCRLRYMWYYLSLIIGEILGVVSSPSMQYTAENECFDSEPIYRRYCPDECRGTGTISLKPNWFPSNFQGEPVWLQSKRCFPVPQTRGLSWVARSAQNLDEMNSEYFLSSIVVALYRPIYYFSMFLALICCRSLGTFIYALLSRAYFSVS